MILGSLMPLLQNWLLLIPPLMAYVWRRSPQEPFAASKKRSGFSLGILAVGLWGGAILEPGSILEIQTLLRDLGWIALAWLVSRSFTPLFSRRFLWLLTLSGVSWMGVGLAEVWSGRPVNPGWLETNQFGTITVRLVSVLGNPNVYALYLVILLILVSFFGIAASRPAAKTVYGMVWMLVTVSLYLTYSRTAWLLAVGFIIFEGWRRFRWRGLGCGGLLLVAAYLWLPGLQLRMMNLFDLSSSSLWYRIRIWSGAWRALRHFWFWGAGPGGFQMVYPQFRLPGVTAQHAHQLYLQLWLEYGFIGLACGLWFLIWLLSRPRTRTDQFGAAVYCVIVCFLVYGLAETWTASPFLGGFFGVIVGISLAQLREGYER